MLGDRITAILTNASRRGPRAPIVDVRHDDGCSFSCEQPRSRLADARAGTRDEADLAPQPRAAQARAVPISRAAPRAMRKMAPSTASIQVELMLEMVRMFVTRLRRMTPVSAP